MNNDDSGKNQLAPVCSFNLERRSDGLVLRGRRDLLPLTEEEKAASLAKIGDIFMAVEAGDIGMVRSILSAIPAQANAQNEGEETPIFLAARFGFTEIAKLLILYGADLNAHDSAQFFDESYGWSARDTPIHIAAYRKQAAVAELLLEHGSDVNSKDWCGRTPLFVAANNSDAEFAGLLLRYGANVNAQVMVSEEAMASPRNSLYLESGATALHYAVRGRLIDTAGFHDTNVIALLLANGADINAVNRWGESPLHFAAEFGHVEAARVLLAHGADPDLRDSRGMTPLDRATYLDIIEMVELLEEYTGELTGGMSRLTHEELRRDPRVFDVLKGRGYEHYRAGITDRVKWHAALYRDAEAIAIGLGDGLEQHFEIIWAAITGEVDYVGGKGGIYGAKLQNAKVYK